MRTLRSWSAALSARLHAMLSALENHEALADAAICQLQTSGARAEAQLARVRRDGHTLRERIQGERRNAERWRERAAALAARDESGALECLRRRRKVQADASALEQRLAEHTRLEEQLGRDLSSVRERLDRLRHQRDQLRARASTAEALRIRAACSTPLGADLPEIFERWERNVREADLGGETDARDVCVAAFDSAEEEASLRAELATLLDEPTSTTPRSGPEPVARAGEIR